MKTERLSPLKIKTKELEERLNETSKESLQSVLKRIPNTDFVQKINEHLEHKKMKKSDLIKKTSLDRNYTYQIFSGERTPGKDKVLQLCLALNLSLEETNRLLALSGNAPLYVKVKRDAVIMFAIKENYSVLKTNELLFEHQLEAL